MSILELFVALGVLGVYFAQAKEFHMDICDGEALNLECPDSQVLLMKRAHYGRMQIGKCIRRDLGFLGCQSSVLGKMDSLCSGFQRCDMPSINRKMFELDDGCSSEVYSYLSLSYECLTAEGLNSACAMSPPALPLSHSEAVIPKPSAHSLPCFASEPFSFRMQALPGQQINLTIINLVSSDRQCFGVVVEGRTGQRSDVCSGSQREALVMLSNSEMLLLTLDVEVSAKYMLKYQVIGCADVAPPVYGWVKRKGDVMEAGCHGNHKEWTLHCVGSQWEGRLNNCSSSNVASETKRTFNSEVIRMSISPDIVIALIIAVAVIICITTVTVGVVCWKRKSMETLQSVLTNQKVAYRAVVAQDSPESGYMTNDRQGNPLPPQDPVYDFCFTPGQPPVGRVKYQLNPNAPSTYSLYQSESQVAPPSSPLYKSLVFDDVLVSSA
ncbi:hypothetical protein CAPTEDRAFT_190616 [Capitella teleta]|uniref:SUEL-type lectin domain-containing protein n=1 Tax=Capitella teleta TaxID=283909 RepID=R7U486_CAPTE|nr:hypothetical protein CAPTEDRAFT_190616 [Capitella teleta]|eukprot:ELU00784.1 hypothetical protein CAPTEDRAFT_190616 [Capitella teleta]